MNINDRYNLNFSIKKLENSLSRGSQPMGTPPVPFRIQPSSSEHSLGTAYWFIVVGDLEDPDPEPTPCTIFLGVDALGLNWDIGFGGISPPHFQCRCEPHKTNEAVNTYNKCLSKCNDILDECKKKVEKNQCAIPGNEPDSIYDQEYVRIRTAKAAELALCFFQHKRCVSRCKSALDKSPNVIPPCYCFPPDFNFLAPPNND